MAVLRPVHSTEHLAEARSRQVIRIGFALVMLIIGFIVLLGIGRLAKVQDTLADIVAHEQVAIEMLFRMQQAARERSVLLYSIASTKDPFERDEQMLQHSELGSQFANAREKLGSLQLDASERVLFDKLVGYTRATQDIQRQVLELLAVDNFIQAQAILNKQAVPSQNRILATINELFEYEIIRSLKSEELLQTQYGQTRFLMVAGGLIAAIFAWLIAIFINRRTGTLIANLETSASQIQEANHSLESLRLAMDHHDIVSIADVQGNITFANDKFCQISLYSREELIGKNHRILKSGAHPASLYDEMWHTISSGKIWQGEVCNRNKSGYNYWVFSTIVPFLDESGLPYQYTSIRTDITAIKEAEQVLMRGKAELEALVHERTAELEEREEQLIQLASTDVLTGICNRRRFNEVLQVEIARAKRFGTPFTLIIFDIDHFKRINDTYGHQAGDQVLLKLSLLVSKNIRNTDLFARWGGEEFTLLATNCETFCPHSLAEKLRVLIEACTFAEVGKVTCSFGATEYQAGDNEESLIKRADHNLYQAKETGRNRVVCGDGPLPDSL